jgi:tetraacyldisaccharide 4'-kinase
MVVVGADRYRAGLHALEHLDPDIFILDDGFQHLRLHRDLNILLMDHARPLGNGRVLPAGLLREPPSAAGRADLIMFTRCGIVEDKIHIDGIQTCHAFHELSGFVSIAGRETEPLPDISMLKGVAFAGIADPDSFFALLEKSGLDIRAEISFADHCSYGEKEIAEILEKMSSVKCDYLITTEKDAVKLGPFLPRLGRIYSATLEVRIPDMKILTERLEKLLYQKGGNMALSKELLDILVCPKCKGDLILMDESNWLACRACRLKYPVKDDIPVMLVDEAEPFPE